MRRNTTQRMAIEQVFRQNERLLGVDEVLKYGRKLVESLNQATVYRNLKLLIDDVWLKRISHPAFGALYERTGKGHHHHFHCCECNRAFELHGCALKEDGIPPSRAVVIAAESTAPFRGPFDIAAINILPGVILGILHAAAAVMRPVSGGASP